MDCNAVFNILTRGPFPSGAPEDQQVERHLETCHDCWRLAEALRPAADLFHESISPAESRTLPGYWGDATPPGVLVAQIAHNAAQPPYRTTRKTNTNPQSGPQAPSAVTLHAAMGRTPAIVHEHRTNNGRELLRIVTFVGLVMVATVGVNWFLS